MQNPQRQNQERAPELATSQRGQMNLNEFDENLSNLQYANLIQVAEQNQIPKGQESQFQQHIDQHVTNVYEQTDVAGRPLMPSEVKQELSKTGENVVYDINNPRSVEQTQNVLQNDLDKALIEYAMTFDDEARLNMTLDELDSACDDALNSAVKYKKKSAKSESGFIMKPLRGFLEGRKLNKLVSSIEENYMKIPHDIRARRFIDISKNDQIGKRSEGTKLVGDTMITAGGGAYASAIVSAFAGAASLATPLGLAGVVTGLSGVVTKLIGNAKTISTIDDTKQAIHELTGLKDEISNIRKQKPYEMRRKYLELANANLRALLAKN